jgi:signal peptidase I
VNAVDPGSSPLGEPSASRPPRASGGSLLGRLTTNVPFALVLVVIVAFRFGLVQTLRVSSINMAPTLAVEDRVVVRGYGADPVCGDVVVYRSPLDPDVQQVGRIIATAGQTVEMDGSGVRIDGHPATIPLPAVSGGNDRATPAAAGAQPCSADECDGDEAAAASVIGAEEVGDHLYFTRKAGALSALYFAARQVPAEHVFVLNDNRVDERDSRILGAIPLTAIVGVASFVYYASDETGIRWDRMNRRVS